MHEPSQQGKTIRVYHLPVRVVERLDKRFGELLAKGGYAEWWLKIEHGQVHFFKSTESEDWLKDTGSQDQSIIR